ncbi:MAG TPA: hypothetical protein VK582_12195 [Pyrinomonadaceae bacterium]|nr:hypothetical protein [Pyrinomonadaceae bacterium]
MLPDTDFARSYLRGNSSVLVAGRKLQKKLGMDFETLDLAISELEGAAESQDAQASSYRAFMFSGFEGTNETQKETRQEITGNILTTIVADLQVGSVLVAAGQAVGETRSGDAAVQEGHQLLEEALKSLQETTPAVERGLSVAISERDAAALTGQQSVHAPQSRSAIKVFRANSEQTMSILVSEFREVAISVLTALKKPLEKINIMEVLEKIGGPLETIGGIIGRLIKKGMEKIQSALDALVNLIGNDALKKINDRVKELWQEIGQKKIKDWTDEVLGDFIGVGATRKTIEDVLGSKLNEQALPQASDDVSRLTQPYRESTAMAKTAVGAISLVSGTLFWFPFAGQKVAFFAALAYLIILSGVLLIAMDYCDSGRILGRVRGVGEIANGLRV